MTSSTSFVTSSRPARMGTVCPARTRRTAWPTTSGTESCRRSRRSSVLCRVALARAFINSPRVLFADEPTGNLDGDTSDQVQELLFSLNREEGTTLILVTHDLELAQRTQRIIRLRNGAVLSDSVLTDQNEAR